MIEKTVAFTGHRKINADLLQLENKIVKQVEQCYMEGYRVFLSGVAMGWDLLAAEVILKLKAICPNIQLIAVIPCPGQADRFSLNDKRRYADVLKRADSKITTSQYYNPGCFHHRDDYLVDNASYIIAYFDGNPKGGTCYTVKRAEIKGKPICNLF